MLKRRTLLQAATALPAPWVPRAPSPRARGPIRIACAGPITGQYAAFGEQMKLGAEQAVADINAGGGVLGRKLVLEVGDDACDPRQAVSVANQMAGRRWRSSPATTARAARSRPARSMPRKASCRSARPRPIPSYTDEGSWNTFRVCGRDDQQGKVAGAYIAKKFKGKKVAILHDNSAYGKGLAEETKKALNAAGMTETLYTAYTPGERDYSALVSRMKEAGVEVIYIGGYHTESRADPAPGQGAGHEGDDDRRRRAGHQGVLADHRRRRRRRADDLPGDPRSRPTAAEVVQSFKAKNIDPEGYVLYTYAAVQIWAAAVEKLSSTDPKKIAEAMKGRPWQTVLGPISFDKKGDVTFADYVFYVWKNGAYSEI